MPTAWITEAAQKHKKDLSEKRRLLNDQLRREEIERDRSNRLALESADAGEYLWEALQSTLKHDVAEFNDAFHDTVLRTKALGDGTFEVHSGEPGAGKIASLSYASASTTLSWQIFGGAKGTPLTIGLEPNQDAFQSNINPLQFTDGNSYYSIGEISQNVISALLG